MDKTIARESLHEPDHDRTCWLSRSPAERLAAVDLLSIHDIGMSRVEPRFVEPPRR